MSINCLHRLAPAAIILLAFVARLGAAETPAPPAPVQVILWFDTEDYLLPADDDCARRLAEMLTERHIRATFKIVGEKARVLEKRGRHDVIDALRKHDIGYHSNFHSVHPAPTEYLADCGLLDGMEEFVRREARGAADVRRIFNLPSLVCYGQPGSSWAPQAVAALTRCGISNDGIPCYLDSGNHVGLSGKPFWYCGALNVYDMKDHETRMNLFDAAEPEPANKRFDEMAARVTAEGGGVISIYYHPSEWVHLEFWDAVNFRRGANPPREQWKAPPQRPAAETEQAFARFGQYLDHMRAVPSVRFVTISQMPVLYPDLLRQRGASPDEVLELARRISSPDSKGIDFQIVNGKAFSPADQFALLGEALDRMIATADLAKPDDEAIKVAPLLLGPDGEPPASTARPEPLNWPACRDAIRDACDFVKTQDRIPARVFIGPDPIPPADFLAAMASVYVQCRTNHQFPQTVSLPSGVSLLTAEQVVKDSPRVFGGWVIHRANFRAPKVLEVARLQAWTLKPAVPAR